MDCIFCKIVDGEIPSYTLYEDEYVKCFLDVNPVSNGHALIIPKKHFVDATDIESKYVLKIFETARKVMLQISKNLKPDGFRLTQNNGNVQEVKHYHLHIIPTYKNKQDKLSVEEIYNKIIVK